MDLYLGRPVRSQQVQEISMIGEFLRATLKYALVKRIEQSELVGVHRDPDTVLPDVSADFRKFAPKMVLPVEPADRVRCERDKAGMDPEKQNPMADIEFQGAPQAFQIACDRIDEPLFRI
jgi:hypothetical protein